MNSPIVKPYLVDIGGEIVDISRQFKENYYPPTDNCTHTAEFGCVLCNPQLFESSIAYTTYIFTEKILAAKKAYYNGNSKLTDSEYDALENTLRVLNPKAPILQKVGS